MFDFKEPLFSDKEKVIIYFKEYDSLRAEIVARTSSYTQIFTVGSAIGAAVIAVTLKDSSALDANRILIVTAFLIVIGMCSVVVARAMFSNTKRLGSHVLDLELKINALAGTQLSHEQKMKAGR